MPFGIEKLEWCGYTTGGGFFEDMFIRFDKVHERDRHTDRQTPHNDISRACIALRGNKSVNQIKQQSI